MQEQNLSKPHFFTLENRKSLSLTGVADVSGFDEETVSLQTSMGNLIVKGEDLHITKLSLDTGEVSIDGTVNSMQYLGSVRKKGLASKLFK